MVCTCHIIPHDVLDRLSKDGTLDSATRKAFVDTTLVDAEMRKLRSQAGQLTRVRKQVSAVLELAAGPPSIEVYDCKHHQALPGTPVPSPETSADAVAKRVFDETTALAAFYAQAFERNSVDGAGAALISSIHYMANYNNAFWNGTQMVYGDGDGKIFVDFSTGNDVIGHELTHGVTQHTLQLAYTDEAGGLNESLSDCFGSMFRQWQVGQDVTGADWLIGKDIMGPAALARGYTCLRDMVNPAAPHCLAPQPTQYAQYTPGMDPHSSSGIPNRAFTAICNSVGGKSWEKVGQIWYKVLTGSGPRPNLQMKEFADLIRAATAALYAGDADLANKVDAGWTLVGL
jgi:Zn-dependent metalloprotease